MKIRHELRSIRENVFEAENLLEEAYDLSLEFKDKELQDALYELHEGVKKAYAMVKERLAAPKDVKA